MSEARARSTDIAASDATLAGHPGATGLMTIFAIVIAAGAVVFSQLSATFAQPLLLTLMALLAMLGVFFLFAMAAGHIRLGERVRQSDVLKAIADSLEDGVLITAKSGVALYANAEAEKLVGRSTSGAIRSLEEVLRGEPQAGEALYRLSRAAERGERRQEEFMVRDCGRTGRTDNAPRWLRISVRPFTVPGKEGELGPLVLWQSCDVTAERLREREALDAFNATLTHYDAMPVGLLVSSADGTIQHMNATLARWLGLPGEVLPERGVKLSDLLSADSVQLLRICAEQSAGDPRSVDLDLTREDGRVITTRLLARKTASAGLVIAAISRNADEEFRSGDGMEELRFARFFQSAPFGIATLSPEGRIVSANAAFARMVLDGTSGVSALALDVLGRGTDASTRESVSVGLEKVLSGRGNVTPIDISVGENAQYARRVFMTPLAASQHSREAAILYVIDATEQKALEAKFAQSQKMEAVGKLAGGIAHDFNNVLTAIIGFSDLLLQTHRPTDPAYRDIMNIKSSANRAAGLVGKLLAYSRRQTLQTEVLQLDEVLTDLAPLLKRSIGEKIQLKLPPSRDIWYVKTDKTQFDQVVINLAVNARDAMPDGGVLTIRARNVTERECQRLHHLGLQLGEYVLVEVEDTGVGMSQEVLARIFEPFFTTKGVGKGTGLGLATVYGIVKQSGGYIYPESTIGKGTVFRVYLPRHHVENEDEIAVAKSTRKEKVGDLTGTGRVLLVEDEDVVRSFAVRALKRQGYEVLEAASGVEALEVMAKNAGKVDIVVSDVVMPEMDGPTLLKELRKRNPKLKIIFVSGYPHEAFKASLDENEEFAFLPKPFSLPQLAAKVKEQLAA